MGEKHRHFSREFKRDAVLLVTERGMPVGKVARESEVVTECSGDWDPDRDGAVGRVTGDGEV